ncbi:DUF1697 domain-containing protein [Arenimonas sp. MALMAid1274]|uniref:DUF1697 domain-containing protein n=1 Tax=Arenimonas sp. MALMAid1274 TaxID=3411630 RepID=UPI003BA11D80
MNRYVALLRAVNVGGTGKLPMADLRALCESAGFSRVSTYIASGNVLFESAMSSLDARARLARALQDYAGKPVGVQLRQPADLARLRDGNPWPGAAGNRVIVVFLEAPLPEGWESRVKGRGEEQLQAQADALYIHYGEGMRESKLVVPDASVGTARNLNTVARLAELSALP